MAVNEGPPTLTDYLKDKWIAARMAEMPEKLSQAVRESKAHEEFADLDAGTFLHWVDEYFTAVRPSMTFAVNNNLGVRFTNNDSVVICPPFVVDDGFQMGANSVRIT